MESALECHVALSAALQTFSVLFFFLYVSWWTYFDPLFFFWLTYPGGMYAFPQLYKSRKAMQWGRDTGRAEKRKTGWFSCHYLRGGIENPNLQNVKLSGQFPTQPIKLSGFSRLVCCLVTSFRLVWCWASRNSLEMLTGSPISEALLSFNSHSLFPDKPDLHFTSNLCSVLTSFKIRK